MRDGITKDSPRLSRRHVLVMGAAAALAGPTLARAADLQPVSVRLDWLPGADHSSLYLALARGYYKDAGLDVQIFRGEGSQSTLQLVGSGNQTIGLASLASLAAAVGKGVPVMAFAGIMQKSPDSVYGLATEGFKQPKDLEHKRFGYVPGDEAQRTFDAFAAKTGIDESTITRVALTESNVYSAVLSGQVDFTVGWINVDAPKIAKYKPITKPMLFADYGVNTLGTGMFATKTTLAKDPDMIRKFLAATIHGADDVKKDPQAGIDAVIKAVPETDRGVITGEMSTLQDFLHTKYSAGHPFGWVAPEDLASTIEIEQKYFDLPASVTAADVYTDKFFPAS